MENAGTSGVTARLRKARGRVRSRFFRWAIAARDAIDRHESDAHLRRCGSVGRGVRVGKGVRVTGHSQVRLGNNVHIGDRGFIRGDGGLVVGDNAHIGRNVTIYTCSHEYEGERLPYDDALRMRPVSIGKNVWIGMNVSIAPGTRIGDGAIVGLGAVVAGKVPPLSIYGATVAVPLGERNDLHYAQLEGAGRYGGVSGRELVQE